MQLKSLAKTTEALNSITSVLNTTYKTKKECEEALSVVGQSYTTETLKSALAQSTLNKEQIKTILSANGLQGELLETTADELANAASTNLVAESQKKTTATTLGLGTAFKGLWISIKKATIALAKFLFTNPVGWATLAVSAIAIAGVAVVNYNKKLEESKKKIRETAEEAKNAVQTIKSDFDTLSSNTDKVKERFSELAQEVENLGKTNQSRGKLSIEDYDEFLELSNQLAKLFPQLTKGYDENGNAILDLSGNVDTIVGSLDNLVSVQQKLANLQIIEKMSDVWAGYTTDLKEYKASLSDAEDKTNSTIKAISQIDSKKTISYDIVSGGEYQFNNENLNAIIHEAVEKIGIEKDELLKTASSFFEGNPNVMDKHTITWNFSSLTESQFKQLKNELGVLGSEYEDAVQLTKNKIEAANSGMASYINTWLSTEWNYNKLDLNMQNAVKSMLFDGDWVNLIPSTVDSGNWDEVSNWLQQKILYEINKVQANEEISKALSEVFMNTELAPEAKVDYIKQIQDYFGEGNEITVLLQPQLEETEILNKQYQDAISKFGKDSQDILKNFFKDNFINDSSEIDYWNAITNGAKSAEEAVRMYNEAMNTNTPASFSDIFSLKDTDDTITNLGKISESIDTIQNAYKTLYDAIEEYNKEGAFSVDTLQSVIALGDDWLDYLVDEDGALKLDKESLEQLTQARLNDMRVQAINSVIDNVSKIESDADANEYLKTTNYALAESYEEVAQKALESARAKMQDAVAAGTLSQANMDAAMDKATADISKINKLFANTSISGDSIMGGGGSSSGGSSSTSEFQETIDFFERRVEVLDNALSHLDSTLDNVAGSFGKNNLIDAELGITEEKFNNYTDALAMYTQKANEAFSKIPADIASRVKDGAVALTDFIGDGNKDIVEAIKEYESWADKIADCQQELAELKKEIRQLELDKFNNIMDDFQNQFTLRDDSKDLISKQVDLLKEAGELIGKSFYTTQIDQSKKQLELLETEKAQLVNQMSSAISSGRVNCCPLLQ